jgi:AcrR family transcriptional regulator
MPARRQPVIETRPRRAADPDSERVAATRARLIDSAERLFLQRDPSTVSVRMINAGAGLNSGAVHYHFGSRDGLLLALLDDRLSGRERLLARMDALAAARRVRIRDVVELAVDPLLRLAAGTRQQRLWVRLLADVIRRDPGSAFARETLSHARWTDLVTRALPKLPSAVVRRRWDYAVVLVLELVERDVDRDALVDFLVGGLSAPVASK